MGFMLFEGSMFVFIFKGTVDFTEFILVTVLLLFISLHRTSLRGPLVSTTVYVAIPSLSLVPFSLSFQFFNKILPPGYPKGNSSSKCVKMISIALSTFSSFPSPCLC